jgi:chromosome segregation ATPase
MASDLIERLRALERRLPTSLAYFHQGEWLVNPEVTFDREVRDAASEAADEIASLRTALAIERERAEKAEKAAEQARVETGEAMLVIEQQDRDLEAVQGKLESVWNKSVSREASLAEAKRLLKPFADALDTLGRSRHELDDRANIRGIGPDLKVTMRDLRAAARFLAQEEGLPTEEPQR